jgi:hypothetical protein
MDCSEGAAALEIDGDAGGCAIGPRAEQRTESPASAAPTVKALRARFIPAMERPRPSYHRNRPCRVEVQSPAALYISNDSLITR